MREGRHSNITRPLSPPRQTCRGRIDGELEENRRFSHPYQSRSPGRENYRYGDGRNRSPPRTREEDQGNRRFSRSYRSPGPVWSEQHRSRQAGRGYEQHGDVRTRTPPGNRDDIEGNRRFSRTYRSRSPVREELNRSRQVGRGYEQHGDARTRTPPWNRDDIERNRRFSCAYRSRSPVREELNRSTQAGREHQQHGDVTTRSPPRHREGRETDLRFSGSNLLYSVQRGEGDRRFNEERDGNLEKLSQFCESLSNKGSTSSKFQWDKILAEDNKPKNPCASSGCFDHSYKTSGAVSNSGVVPTSLSMENVGPRTNFGYHLDGTKRGGNHGLIDGGIGNVTVSPFSKPVSERFEIKRSSAIDPIVDIVERNDASVVGYHDVERVRVSHSMRQEEKDVKDCRIDHGECGVFVRERGNMGSQPMESSFQNMNVIGNTSIVDMIDRNGAAVGDHIRESRMKDNHGCFGERYHYAERVSLQHSREQDGRDEKKGCRTDPVEHVFVHDKDESHLRNGAALGDHMRESRMKENHGCFGERYHHAEKVSVQHSMEQDGRDKKKNCRTDPVEYGSVHDKDVSHLMKTFFSEGPNVGSLPMESPCGNPRVLRTRTCTADPISDMIGGNDVDFREKTRTSRMLDNHGSLQERYIDVSSVPSRSFEQDHKDEEALVSRNDNMYYENLKSTEDCGFERNGASMGSYGDGYRRLPVSYDGMYATENSPQRVAMEEEPGIRVQSEIMLEGQHTFDKEASIHDQRSALSPNWNDLEQMHDVSFEEGEWTHLDNEQYSLQENSGLRHLQSGRDEWMIDGTTSLEHAYYFNPLPCTDLLPSENRHPRKPVEPPKSNVKQRLGPLNVKQRLGPAQNAFKSLGAAQTRRKLPWVKIHEEPCLDDSEGTLNIQGVKSSKMKKKHAQSEALKDSDEFMQLVQKAFLKFSKLLNENSANRRKYLEKGGNANLRCCVCGSTSKDFVDTLSLAQHTIMSCKGGSRAEHWGLHKALCVLMGWNSAEFPDSHWVRQILPDVEASSLKEDLIIWPPVVIIHNRSIANDNPDERIIVSIEGLRDILRGTGFGQGMTSVCRGKAANQSTMVVIFSGTFSGLQGAERLHKLYAASKHGRTEFQQIGIGLHNRRSLQTQGGPSNTVENVLYGYLGIAIDLDKLDFETKKRCVVKSKKEIKAVADFSLNTE